MNWFQKNFKTIIYISFLVPILTVAFVSISHVTKWYGISNPFSWAIYLSFGIEIAALSALAAISAQMGRKVYFPFGIVTLIQFIGNIYFAYQYIDVNGQAFKDWVDLVSPIVSFLGVEQGDMVGHKRFLALFAGGMLPIISLSFLHMLVKFEEEDKKTVPQESEKIELPQPVVDLDELSKAAGKLEAEQDRQNFTMSPEDLERLERYLKELDDKKFGFLVDEKEEEPIVEQTIEPESTPEPQESELEIENLQVNIDVPDVSNPEPVIEEIVEEPIDESNVLKINVNVGETPQPTEQPIEEPTVTEEPIEEQKINRLYYTKNDG